MKTFAESIKSLLCLALLPLYLAFGSANVLAAPAGSKAEVKSIKGSASFAVKGSKEFKPLKVGSELVSGDTIKTGADGVVDLSIPLTGSIRINPSSTLTLDTLTLDKSASTPVVETKLNLTSGSMFGKTPKLASSASKYEIKTPTSVAGIRGTSFKVYASGAVYCIEGLIVVTYYPPGSTEGVKFEVPAGKTFIPPTTPGGKPSVVDLPPSEATAIKEATDESYSYVLTGAGAEGGQAGGKSGSSSSTDLPRVDIISK